MKSAWFFLAAVLFLVSGCQAGRIPVSAHQPGSDQAVSGSGPKIPHSPANAESMHNMLKEMRLLTEQGSLNPRQQAEMNALMKQLQSLRQQARHTSTDRNHHYQKIQEIQQRLDDIKRQIQQKPYNPRKLPVYICTPGSIRPGPPGQPLDVVFPG